MEEFYRLINQPLPIGIVILVGLIVLWIWVNEATKTIKEMKKKCDDRFKWCIDHFESKNTKRR